MPALLEANGYLRFFPMSSFELDLSQPGPLAPRNEAILADPAFSFLPLTRQTFTARMEDARLVLNAGFDANPMFVPVSREEFAFQAGDMMWIMDRRLSVVAHHRGNPVGVVVCIPDMNPFCRMTRSRLSLLTPWHYLRARWRRERAVVVFYSVAPAMHGRGLMPVLLHKVVSAARSAGYRHLGVTWIADSNHASLKQMSRLGAGRCHRLHLFRKPI
jgi:GNAT superfamily N-acetyltransferase